MTFTEHIGGINIVLFFPNGIKLASGSYDNTIKIWNLTTGYCE